MTVDGAFGGCQVGDGVHSVRCGGDGELRLVVLWYHAVKLDWSVGACGATMRDSEHAWLAWMQSRTDTNYLEGHG